LHDALMQLGFVTQAEGLQSGWHELFDALVRDRRATAMTAPSVVSVPGAVATGSIDPNINDHDPVATDTFWVAAERLNQIRAIHPQAQLKPEIESPEPYASESWNFDEALVEILRGRLEGLGPVTVEELARSFALPANQIQIALAKLESEGFAMQGQFTPVGTQPSSAASMEEQHAGTRAYPEWC